MKTSNLQGNQNRINPCRIENYRREVEQILGKVSAMEGDDHWLLKITQVN